MGSVTLWSLNVKMFYFDHRISLVQWSLHTHIHLDEVRVKILSYIKKKKVLVWSLKLFKCNYLMDKV